MKWDGQAYAEDIKYGLFMLLSNEEKVKAKTMKHKEFTELFRNHHKQEDIQGFCRKIGSGSIVLECKFDCIEFDFQRPLNNFGDSKIALTWSMAARHIRYWVQEETEEKEMTAEFNLGAMLGTPTASTENQVKQIPCDMLIPYHNHKFELYSGERLDDMVESIKDNGVLIPIIVQPLNGQYEILIGHNRWNASKLAGKQTVPAIIKEGLTDEEAEMYVIESNLMQRGFDNLKISEQAAVIAMRHSQMFSQGKRNDIIRELELLENPELANDDTLSPMDTKLDTNKAVGEEYGMSRATVARLIRIDKLNDELKSYVDRGKLSVRAGVQLSYLDKVTQAHICGVIEDYKIDIKKAAALRAKADDTGSLSVNDIIKILVGDVIDQEKPKNIKISSDTYSRYFDGCKADEVANIIENALELYFKQLK